MLISAAAPVAFTAQTRIEHLAATDLFTLAEKAAAAHRIGDALKFYDALAHDPDDQVRAEARFRKGMLLADNRRYREAALAFRALLDEKPQAVRVRLELARVLALIGDEGAARRELRQAQAEGLPPDVATTVSRFSQALRSTRRAGGSVELALAPDSNLNRATQQRTLDTIIAPLTLSRDARARSGLGARLAGSGYLRLPVGNDVSLLPRVSSLADLYRAHQFDDVSAEGLVGLEWRRGTDRWTPSVGEGWRWYGGSLYARTATATLSWLHPAGLRGQWLLSGSASRARYRQNDLQDGAIYGGSITYERALTVRAGVSATVTGTRQDAHDPGYATWSGGGSLLGWRDWGRSTLSVTLGVQRLRSDQPLFLFPERRREWLFDAGTGVTLRRFAVHGFAPLLRVSYERNRSTVALYDYRRLSGNVGIVRAF